jgi:hypothetical protein
MRFPALVLAPSFVVLAGCAGSIAGPEGADAETTTTTSAVVAVERTTDTTDGAGPRATASARFLRVTTAASSFDALRAIGATLNLPARGACATIGSRTLEETGAGRDRGSLTETPAAQAPVVELVDVGEVSLSAGGLETRLVARQLPDVTDVVSGVVYARAADPSLLPASARYTLRIAGGQVFGPMQIMATAPADPADIQIAGENAGLVLVVSPSVDLSWPADAADDAVYVDVQPASVRCALDRGTHGTVAAALLDDTGTLVVHRLHREPLRLQGIDSGEVRFDFARTVAYVRR